MQMNRLFEMVYLLMDRRSLTAKELAAHFEVSPRTVLRDVDRLAAAGIPIYTAQGKGGGVRLMEGFVLNKSVLTEGEQSNILSALQSLQAVNVPEIAPVLAKLAALFNKNTAASWVDIDFSPWDGGEGEKEKFLKLKEAILTQKLVSFEYFSFWGEKTSRWAEPLQLVFKEKAWYLSAFCRDRGDWRTFKLSRIKNLALSQQGFEAKPPRPVAACFAPQCLCQVQLKIEEELAPRVWDDFEPSQITQNEDGSLLVTASLPDDEWGYGYILSYGAGAEVLAPAYIRTLIADKLAEAAKKYL